MTAGGAATEQSHHPHPARTPGRDMNTVTHALIPVICARLAVKRNVWMGRWTPYQIALAGASPDLLNPHLSLEARMTSWSHGLPAWLAFTAILIISSLVSRGKLPMSLVCWLSGAYLLHIACDAISGGVNLLYPVKTWVIGDYWIDPVWWVPLDVLCLLVVYFLFRVIPTLWSRHQK